MRQNPRRRKSRPRLRKPDGAGSLETKTIVGDDHEGVHLREVNARVMCEILDITKDIDSTIRLINQFVNPRIKGISKSRDKRGARAALGTWVRLILTISPGEPSLRSGQGRRRPSRNRKNLRRAATRCNVRTRRSCRTGGSRAIKLNRGGPGAFRLSMPRRRFYKDPHDQ